MIITKFTIKVIDGKLIVSDKMGDVTVISSRRDENSGLCTIGTTEANVVVGDAYLLKTEYNLILMAVCIAANTFRFTGDELEVGEVLSYHKTFKYPVMYRPFFVNSYVIDFVNRTVVVSEDGSTAQSEFNDELYKTKTYVYNGLTYGYVPGVSPGYFGVTTFNGDDITLTRGTSDLATTTPHAMTYFEHDNFTHDKDENNNDIVETFANFTYSVTEGRPGSISSLAEKPYGIEMITREQTSSIGSAHEIFYAVSDGKYFFTNDAEDYSDNYKYFLIKNQALSMPLIEDGIVTITKKADDGVQTMTLIPCLFMDGFNTKFKVNGVGLNKVGTETTVIYYNNMFMFVYKNSDGINTLGFANQTGTIENTLTSNYLKPHKKYALSPLVDVSAYVENAFSTLSGVGNGTANIKPIFFNRIMNNITVNEGDFVILYNKDDYERSEGSSSFLKIVRIFPTLTKVENFSNNAAHYFYPEETSVMFDYNGGTTTINVATDLTSDMILVETPSKIEVQLSTDSQHIVTGITINAEACESEDSSYSGTIRFLYNNETREEFCNIFVIVERDKQTIPQPSGNTSNTGTTTGETTGTTNNN